MVLSTFDVLKAHVGHDIVFVEYDDGEVVSIECETCNEVLDDYASE